MTYALSNHILRNHISQRVSTVVMFVDLVDSTKISTSISPKELPNVIKGFSQEVTFVIEYYGGHVLKFVGDEVLAYFLIKEYNKISHKTINSGVKCAFALFSTIEKSLNPILEAYNLLKLGLHIGIDYGKNNVVLYGSDKRRSHIDLIGSSINLAAKMESISGKNKIVIGEQIFTKLNSRSRENFKKIIDSNRWNYYYSHIVYGKKSSFYSVYESLQQSISGKNY